MTHARTDTPIEIEDIGTNSSSNEEFSHVLQARMSRRSLLKGGFGLAASSFMGTGLLACADVDTIETPKTLQLNFTAVPKGTADVVAVPSGYSSSVLYRLGDPIAAGVPAYRNDGTDAAASYAQRAGDHHDGMHYFGVSATGTYSLTASDRGLLVMNHEAISPLFLHPTGPTIVNNARTVPDEVLKEMYVHGISVIEVNRAANGAWSYKQDSAFNRRVHTLTDTILSGPAARTLYMITKYSPDGSRTRGTINNCANGYTPWGTYLGCEENYAGYFRRVTATDNANRTPKELTSFARNGIAGNGRELWATVAGSDPDGLYARWNTMKLGASADGSDDYRNVANTYGWNVEVDPFNATSTPKKRTAMGRFAHEGAWLGPIRAGQPLVFYMGDDSRGEYVYKYVTNANWDPADATRGLAAGDKYLDDGKLYVARFNADGTGQWVELRFGQNGITAANPAYAFADQADVLINTRLAADAAGATKMDRPEWGAVHPTNGDVYMTMTNNSSTVRTLASTDAANPRFYNDKRTTGQDQRGNPNGHIIRWAETAGNNAATTFSWDIFLFAARASVTDPNINVSGLTAANDMSSPDGIWFSRSGVLWIQTDDGAYTDVTNCMMLACIPGRVGDGTTKTIVNTDGAATKSVTTKVGAQMTEANLRRFLVGPKDCEITGIAETPDGKTIFVNIQHPGEDTSSANFLAGNHNSNWPGGAGSRPRSATIVITRNDGGEVGASLV
ncbi:MAG: PhoX family phosphatase [Betaproteobacteria bacterium]|nr:PhoX family phosphatase [Betaproteobacteria bacterium]